MQAAAGSASGQTNVNRGNLDQDLMRTLVDAFEKLDWVQWVKSQMAMSEAQSGRAGGEVGSHEGMDAMGHATPAIRPDREESEDYMAEDVELRKSSKERANGKRTDMLPCPPKTSYAAGQAIGFQPDMAKDKEHYQRLDSEHLGRLQRHDVQLQGREETARRALQYAERHGVSYEDGLVACGGSMPTEILPSKAV